MALDPVKLTTLNVSLKDIKVFLSLLSGDLWKQDLDVSKVIGVGNYYCFKWLPDSH